MAAQSGLGARLLLGGYDLTGDISAVDSVSGSLGELDATTIDMLARARMGGLRDGGMSFGTFFDASGAHPVLSALPKTDVQAMLLLPSSSQTQAVGNHAAACNGLQIGYDPDLKSDGSLLLKVAVKADQTGLEWGRSLTAGVRSDTAATDGADLDNGAATSFGAQAYLHVTAFTGTDATVKVQHSADNATWADLLTFAAVSAAPATDRQVVTGTVDRYVRAVSATTGGFTALSFAVVFCRNQAAVSF